MIQLKGKMFKVSDIIVFTKYVFFKFQFGRGDCSPTAPYSLSAHMDPHTSANFKTLNYLYKKLLIFFNRTSCNKYIVMYAICLLHSHQKIIDT